MTENPILYVYKGEWGLPSIDFDCLRALCAVKVTKAPITINTNGNPFRSGRGHLPYIQLFNRKIVGYNHIVEYLKEQGYSINDQLPRHISSLAEAYECLVFNDLHPYFQYFLFGNPDNTDATRKLYALRTPFPFNFYYPGTYMKHAAEVVEVYGGFSVHEKTEFHATETLLLNAKKCVNILSAKLDKNKWFFGAHASTFDIMVYAYLSVLSKISLLKHPLQMHLQECPNLIQFVNRITKDYFAEEAYSSKEVRDRQNKGENPATTMTPSEQEFAASKRTTQILAAICAFVVMSAYATWMGIVKIGDPYYDDRSYRDDDDDDDEEN